ncbi:hypothetical protein ES708_18742 [subsurface metagenome]
MRKLNWGILIVTLLISVLALASAFYAHSKVDRLEERVAELEERVAEMEDGPKLLENLYMHQQGDDKVIAVVQGMEVTMRPIRIGSSFARSMFPELSENESLKQVMTELFKRKALLAEAKRLGIDATEEGYAEYMNSKTAYEDPQRGGPIRDHIKTLGMSDDEYWKKALPGYIEAATIVKLWNMHIEDIGLEEATYEEQWQAKNRYAAELLANARIIWKAPALEAIYISK